MRFKHFLHKLIALVLAVVMLMPSVLSTFASAQSADIGGWFQGGALTKTDDGSSSTAQVDAIRFTFIDAGSETAPRKMREPARSRMERGIRADCVQFCTPCRS